MKKIATGVTVLLITLFLFITIARVLTVAEGKTTEGESQIAETPQTTFTINNSLERASVAIYVEENVLYIENRSSKELGRVSISIDINGECINTKSNIILGFGTYSLKLTDFFSEDYINGNNVNINVDVYRAGVPWGAIMIILLVFFALLIFVVSEPSFPKFTRKKRCR